MKASAVGQEESSGETTIDMRVAVIYYTLAEPYTKSFESELMFVPSKLGEINIT